MDCNNILPNYITKLNRTIRLCTVFVLWAVANLVVPTTAISQELSAEVQKFYDRVGIKLLRPAEGLRNSTSSSQHFYEMQISLYEQEQLGLLSSKLEVWKTRRGLPGEPSIIFDDFERKFPGKNWQILKGYNSPAWGKDSANPISGSFSLWSAQTGKKPSTSRYANNSLTWLISGPYDLSETEYAGLNFYAWLKTQLDFDIFFWGVSINGVDFCGIGTSGDSKGWQFVNFNFDDVPILGSLSRSSQIWIAFFFVSDAAITDKGVWIDKVKFVQDGSWRKEYSAVVNGSLNPNAYSGGIGLARPAFVDIENDGDFDLFVGEYDGNINFYRNDGSKTSPVWTFVNGNYGAIDVGENSAPTFVDIDKDGDPDLFVGDSEGRVSYFQNIGNAQKAVWEYVGKLNDAEGRLIDVGTTSTPAFVDIDNDGDSDLFIGNTEGYFAFYRNDSQPAKMAWRLVTSTFLGVDVGDLSAPTFADINGDGNVDLFTGIREKTIIFYKNTGTPVQPAFSLGSTNFDSIEVEKVTSPAFVDIDGDGDLDLSIGQADGQIAFFLNEGDKTQWKFKSARAPFNLQTIDVGFQSAPALVDIDDDGDLDLTIGSAYREFNFYKNVGTAQLPKWSLASEYFDETVVKNWTPPAFVDIDGDGDLDLFRRSKLGKISFFRNDGNKSNPKWTLVSDDYDSLVVGGQAYPTFADIDDDGDYDLFVGTDNQGITFYRNVGTPHKPKWKLVTNNFLNLKYIYRLTPLFVDIDKDGDLDFFAGSHSGTLIFCKNIGDKKNPKFKLITTKYNNIDVRYFSIPAFADIDNDGDFDLFLGSNSGGLDFWRNLSNEPTHTDNKAELIQRINQTHGFIHTTTNPF